MRVTLKDMTREHAALSASAPPSAFHTPKSARPTAAPSTPTTDSARSIQIRRAWFRGVQDFSLYRRKKFRNPGLARPSCPGYINPERIDLWHSGCAHAGSIWDQYPEVKDDQNLRKEILYSPRAQEFIVNSTTSTPDGAAPITAAAASTPMTSPPPNYRSSTPLLSNLRTQLRSVAAARIEAPARGRAARKVAHDARLLWIARHFRATPLRSFAATDIARVARSFLSRRHFGRGGRGIVLLLLLLLLMQLHTTQLRPQRRRSRQSRRHAEAAEAAARRRSSTTTTVTWATTASRTTTTNGRASLLLELTLRHTAGLLSQLPPTSRRTTSRAAATTTTTTRAALPSRSQARH